jgi:hypothetical protein
MDMLTRSQVARRLGKSIATVRRMEGSELHPWKDDAGVHRFDPDEVDSACAAPRPRFEPPSTTESGSNEGHIEELESQLAEADDEIRYLRGELTITAARDRRLRAVVLENRHLRQALELSIECIIAQLGPKTPRALLARAESLIRSMPA